MSNLLLIYHRVFVCEMKLIYYTSSSNSTYELNNQIQMSQHVNMITFSNTIHVKTSLQSFENVNDESSLDGHNIQFENDDDSDVHSNNIPTVSC